MSRPIKYPCLQTARILSVVRNECGHYKRDVTNDLKRINPFIGNICRVFWETSIKENVIGFRWSDRI